MFPLIRLFHFERPASVKIQLSYLTCIFWVLCSSLLSGCHFPVLFIFCFWSLVFFLRFVYFRKHTCVHTESGWWWGNRGKEHQADSAEYGARGGVLPQDPWDHDLSWNPGVRCITNWTTQVSLLKPFWSLSSFSSHSVTIHLFRCPLYLLFFIPTATTLV